VFHFVCIYMKKLHFHLFTRDKSYLTMILLLEKELTIYSSALSDIVFLSYKNFN